MTLLFLILQFITYFILIKFNKVPIIFTIISLLFIFSAIGLRILIPISLNADFDAYFYSYYDNESKSLSMYELVLKEPYLLSIKKIISFFSIGNNDINILYWWNFLITIIFFIWIAYRDDVAKWKKIIIYSLYFCLFSYTLLRNAPAYILVGVMFYYIQREKKWNFGYLAFTAHGSSLLALSTTLFNNKKPNLKFIIYAIFVFIAIFFLSKISLFSSLLLKFDSYSSSEKQASLLHYAYFVLFNIVTVCVFFNNKKIVNTKIYFLLYMTCIVFFLINPVMYFRFSIYVISYLLLSPSYKNLKIDVFLNKISILFLLLFIYTFLGNNPGLKLY